MLESLSQNIFTYKKLTPEEQHSRGILGRLAGVIADTLNETRNGRQYSSKLWDNVFNDAVMQEKIANRCCFGELGHPADREEVDMEKIAICLAEQPKLGQDGKLYGVFDILDTPNGRILKTLCDYGANIGVSSRGSGDIMANNEVDPDTYYCECWDAVIVPAVKTARPQYVMESLDTKSIKLKASLRESYNAASEEDKKIMKETLKDLDIELEEDRELTDIPVVDMDDVDIDEIPMAEGENNLILDEADEEEIPDAEDEEVEVEEIPEDEVEEESEESEDASEESDEEEATIEDAQTVKEFIDMFKEYDKDLDIEFKPIVIDDVEHEIQSLVLDDSEDGKLVIEIAYSPEMDNIEEVETEVEDEPEEISDEAEEETEEAEDDGAEEVIESLKEMVRQKDKLENEVKSLKDERAVNDEEVKSLKEELNKYKSAFERTSAIAAKAKALDGNIKQLKEQLDQKNAEITKLKHENSVKLTEGLNKSEIKITKLNEQLASKDTELEETKAKLTEQVDIYRKKLNERTSLASAYKNRCNEVTEKYVSFRASMLGVKPAEITNKLNENYTINDIDAICDNILTESVSMNKLPYSFDKGSRIKITEQKSVRKNPEYGYDIDDSLLELAGLK